MANILSKKTSVNTLQITVDGNPSLSSGTSAPIGSTAEATDGSGTFYKYGSGNTDWSLCASTTYVASAITAASSTFKKLSADVVTTIATETVLTDLTFPVLANSTYLIRGRMSLGCNNTGGVSLGVKFPTASVCSGQATGRAANNSSYVALALTTSGSLSVGLNTVNSQGGFAIVELVLIVGANAGNFEVIFASTVGTQTSTAIANGTVLEYIKIA